MNVKYTQQQLSHIRNQALIYQCACPAQVCVAIDAISKLYDYQLGCIDTNQGDEPVHQQIKKSAEQCYLELENCLTSILEIEGWDMETLTMPDNLKKLVMQTLD